MNCSPLACLISFFFTGAICRAAPPAWWSGGNPPVLDSNYPSNNKGPANIGQAKWMAKNALEALRAVSATTAEAVEADLVGVGKPITSWNPPTNSAEQAAQKAPVLIGQLKAISAPFYTHINTFNATWLENERTLNQTAISGTYFPWTPETTDDANKAIATIGQLKAVFSLRFETLPPSPSGPIGLPPVSWYVRFFGDADLYGPDDDPDGDGRTNAQEYLDGSDPSDAASHSGLLKLVVHTRLE